VSRGFFLVAGDLLPVLDAALEDEFGEPVDLSVASSVVCILRPSGVASALFVASCAFSLASPGGASGYPSGGASCGRVTHAWATGAVPTAPGAYQARFRATYPGNRTLTVPNPGWLAVTVDPSVG